MNCLFCKIADGSIPSNKVYEDGDIKVILELSDGSKCCAVSDDVSLSSALFPGNTVWLNIRDVDFILSACDHTSS